MRVIGLFILLTGYSLLTVCRPALPASSKVAKIGLLVQKVNRKFTTMSRYMTKFDEKFSYAPILLTTKSKSVSKYSMKMNENLIKTG